MDVIDGVDSFAEPGRSPGLACRMYHTAAGLAGTPDLTALRQFLKRAADQAPHGRSYWQVCNSCYSPSCDH